MAQSYLPYDAGMRGFMSGMGIADKYGQAGARNLQLGAQLRQIAEDRQRRQDWREEDIARNLGIRQEELKLNEKTTKRNALMSYGGKMRERFVKLNGVEMVLNPTTGKPVAIKHPDPEGAMAAEFGPEWESQLADYDRMIAEDLGLPQQKKPDVSASTGAHTSAAAERAANAPRKAPKQEQSWWGKGWDKYTHLPGLEDMPEDPNVGDVVETGANTILAAPGAGIRYALGKAQKLANVKITDILENNNADGTLNIGDQVPALTGLGVTPFGYYPTRLPEKRKAEKRKATKHTATSKKTKRTKTKKTKRTKTKTGSGMAPFGYSPLGFFPQERNM